MTHPNFGMDLSHAKSRYSLSYLYALCAHVGCVVKETPQDSDVHAVDATVEFEESDVRVQLKCTSAKQMDGDSITVSFKETWIKKWMKCQLPVYIVLVVVPDDQTDWVDYGTESTLHRTQAYWARFDRNSRAKSIRVPQANRFSVDTLVEWHAQFANDFGEEEAS